MGETTQEERDDVRRWFDYECQYDDEMPQWAVRAVYDALNDADRLATIERRVIYRTEDMPDGAEMWIRDQSRVDPTRWLCRWRFPDGTNLPAPDLFPDEQRCMRRLPIIDPPEDTP